ncbi:MAG: hypothetical protein HYT35_01515 [Candidatus Staskawiczbacteria bacterium]|nr:hypothetical protein [Candidatus Staskawiczbacteria bacterium]
MKQKSFIQNIAVIVILLITVFLSQQPYFSEFGRAYWVKATDWFENNVYQKISGEVEQKSVFVQQEVEKQKNNVAQNIWERFKNYFAEKFSKTFGTQVK